MHDCVNMCIHVHGMCIYVVYVGVRVYSSASGYNGEDIL